MEDSTIEVKTKFNEKFYDLLKKTKKKSKIMDKYEEVALHNCELIDKEKTIIDNNIKNGDNILFFKPLDKKGQNNDNIEKELNEQLQRLFEEYKAIKLAKYFSLMESIKDARNIPPFKFKYNKDELYAFILSKEKEFSVKVKEHDHKLVYCLTKFECWVCNKCNELCGQLIGKYYCSLCNYNFCENCRIKYNYTKKREFPKFNHFFKIIYPHFWTQHSMSID
jgi:hypothetical protein